MTRSRKISRYLASPHAILNSMLVLVTGATWLGWLDRSPGHQRLLSRFLDGRGIIHYLVHDRLYLADHELQLVGNLQWWFVVTAATLSSSAYLIWMKRRGMHSYAVLLLAPTGCLIAVPHLVAGVHRLGLSRWLAPPNETGAVALTWAAGVAAVLFSDLAIAAMPRSGLRTARRRRFRQRPVFLQGPLTRWMLAAAACGFWLVTFLPILSGWWLDDSQRAAMYRRATHTGLNDADYAMAEVAAQRLATLPLATSEDRFLVAQVAAACGDTARAVGELARLAEEDASMSAEANLWMASQLLESGEHLQSSTNLLRLLRHLESAVETQPEATDAAAALAQLYVATKQFSRAESHLARVVDERPDLQLLLARVLVLLGKPELAAREAAAAKALLHKRAEAQPESAELALAQAEAHLILEDFATSVGILEDSQALLDEQLFRSTLARHYLAWYDSLSRRAPEQRGRRFQLLEKAQQLVPHSEAILGRLAVMATDPEFDEAIRARARLNEIPNDELPATAHLVLGTHAYQQGDLTAAIDHLERAYALDSKRPEIVNNLAWFLASTDPPQLNRALALANQLVNSLPSELHFRETRGQILAKLGRWDEAVADLESASQVMQGHRPLHATLADAYERAGNAEVAAAHRQLSGKDRRSSND